MAATPAKRTTQLSSHSAQRRLFRGAWRCKRNSDMPMRSGRSGCAACSASPLPMALSTPSALTSMPPPHAKTRASSVSAAECLPRTRSRRVEDAKGERQSPPALGGSNTKLASVDVARRRRSAAVLPSGMQRHSAPVLTL
eukprot:6198710-Pleurochrysis_carterae.AAC.2